MHLSDFQFDLPAERIARYPTQERTASRLMVLKQTQILHRQFANLIDFLEPGDLLVFNNTKVMRARLIGHKASGGKVEVFIERVLDTKHCIAQARASKALKIGDHVYFSQHLQLEIIDKKDHFYTFYSADKNLFDLIEQIGEVPLPPYLGRKPDTQDQERYQTVYAEHLGSVAAPTAGFHFDTNLLQQIQQKNIATGFLTLHIGAGTFAPVRENDIRNHRMHSEIYTIDADLCAQVARTKAAGKRIIAVGTTSLRALESASSTDGHLQPQQTETNIFIYPGYQFRLVDALITNFHLPGSTLLMLVSAFAGLETTLHAYHTAIAEQYHFYSYGDAMFITARETLTCPRNTL